jgi:hypothetical protein
VEEDGDWGRRRLSQYLHISDKNTDVASLAGWGAQEGEHAQRDGLGWVAGKLSFTP